MSEEEEDGRKVINVKIRKKRNGVGGGWGEVSEWWDGRGLGPGMHSPRGGPEVGFIGL